MRSDEVRASYLLSESGGSRLCCTLPSGTAAACRLRITRFLVAPPLHADFVSLGAERLCRKYSRGPAAQLDGLITTTDVRSRLAFRRGVRCLDCVLSESAMSLRKRTCTRGDAIRRVLHRGDLSVTGLDG